MHWAKPKDQTMLEGCSSDGHSEQGTRGPSQSSGDIKIGSRTGWESDGSSDVYKEFRNYKI